MKIIIITENKKIKVVNSTFNYRDNVFEYSYPERHLVLNYVLNGRKYTSVNSSALTIFVQNKTCLNDLPINEFNEGGVFSISPIELLEVSIFSCCSSVVNLLKRLQIVTDGVVDVFQDVSYYKLFNVDTGLTSLVSHYDNFFHFTKLVPVGSYELYDPRGGLIESFIISSLDILKVDYLILKTSGGK